jgi:hypothetical protein
MEREVCSPQPTTLDTNLPQSNICNILQETSSRFPSNQKKSKKLLDPHRAPNLIAISFQYSKDLAQNWGAAATPSLVASPCYASFPPSRGKTRETKFAKKGRDEVLKVLYHVRKKNEYENVLGIRAPTSLDKCHLLRLAVSKVLTDGEFSMEDFISQIPTSPPRTPKPPRKLK